MNKGDKVQVMLLKQNNKTVEGTVVGFNEKQMNTFKVEFNDGTDKCYAHFYNVNGIQWRMVKQDVPELYAIAFEKSNDEEKSSEICSNEQKPFDSLEDAARLFEQTDNGLFVHTKYRSFIAGAQWMEEYIKSKGKKKKSDK